MVSTRHRLTIRTIDRDPRSAVMTAAAEHLGLHLAGEVDVADIVFVEGDIGAPERQRLHDVLVDPLLQTGTWDAPGTGPGTGSRGSFHGRNIARHSASASRLKATT